MRKILIIGIGSGNPEHVTIQAINALHQVDVFFVTDKGSEKEELSRLRREICERYVTKRNYRIVEIPDPPRDRSAPDYRGAVTAWHANRAAVYEGLIVGELDERECGAFLVWGDPAIYDSTLRIIAQIAAGKRVAFEYEVIPGISSIQALAARHKIPLNEIGDPIHITTGRRLATNGWPLGASNLVVMLDGQCAFSQLHDPDIAIYWGANLGLADEIAVAGPLLERSPDIKKLRDQSRRRKGWIMDTYLLRRREGDTFG